MVYKLTIMTFNGFYLHLEVCFSVSSHKIKKAIAIFFAILNVYKISLFYILKKSELWNMNSEFQGKKSEILKYKLKIRFFLNKKSQLPYLFIYTWCKQAPYFIFSVASNLYTVIYFIFYFNVEHENDSFLNFLYTYNDIS